MSQLKPITHPLFTIPIEPEEARSFFEDDYQAQEILRHLRRDSTPSPASISAFEAVATACHRYAKASRYHFPRLSADADWYARLDRTVSDFCELIEDGDPHTVNRLIAFLALESPDCQDVTLLDTEHVSERATNSRLEELMDFGRDMLNKQLFEFQTWASAIKRAADIKNVEGRTATKTPLLMRSLVHELVDIWCQHHNEPFVAPTTFPFERDWARSNQAAALFVEVVLRNAGFLDPKLDWVRILEKVRIEREQEWAKKQSEPNYEESRLKALQDAHLQAAHRRKYGPPREGEEA